MRLDDYDYASWSNVSRGSCREEVEEEEEEEKEGGEEERRNLVDPDRRSGARRGRRKGSTSRLQSCFKKQSRVLVRL